MANREIDHTVGREGSVAIGVAVGVRKGRSYFEAATLENLYVKRLGPSTLHADGHISLLDA